MADDESGIGPLTTESVRPELADLDQWSVDRLVRLMVEDNATVAVAVAAAADSIARAADAIVAGLRAGGRLIYVGAGTPGRLAVLDAAELQPTFGVPPTQVVALIAGGDAAVLRAAEDVEDDRELAERDVRRLRLRPADVVVGIAASGRTPYVLAAVEAAREVGASTVGLSNNPRSALSSLVDHPIEVLTGPEAVAGSTRMKAGTAQKVVLHTLSTVVMIALGRVYQNLMVDLQPTNAKLQRRVVQIVSAATGVDERTAQVALEDASGEAKTAIVSLLAGVAPEQARTRLVRSGGIVRGALRDVDHEDAAD